jgi:hypothetical protein
MRFRILPRRLDRRGGASVMGAISAFTTAGDSHDHEKTSTQNAFGDQEEEFEIEQQKVTSAQCCKDSSAWQRGRS